MAKKFLILGLFLIIFISALVQTPVAFANNIFFESFCYEGTWFATIMDDKGNPIPEARVIIMEKNGIGEIFKTDKNGNISILNEDNTGKIKITKSKFYNKITYIKTCDSIEIPEWVKNNAKWWLNKQIDDDTFISGIQFLVQNKILKMPQTSEKNIETNYDIVLPQWIKTNTKWWSEGAISDLEYITNIQFLVRSGIIKIPTNTFAAEKTILVDHSKKDDQKNESSEIILSKIENSIHELTNKQRQTNDLEILNWDSGLSSIARTHSQDMANQKYLSHKSLDGILPEDRGATHGYDICGSREAVSIHKLYEEILTEYEIVRKNVNDENQEDEASLYNQLVTLSKRIDSHIENKELFGGISENIAQNWRYDSITFVDGFPVYEWNDEETIAQETVDAWMSSKSHKENLLGGFQNQGVGIAISSDNRIYITQNFC